MTNIPVPPVIQGSSEFSSLTTSNIMVNEAIIQNAVIENAVITNNTSVNTSDVLVLTAPSVTMVPLTHGPVSVPYGSATYYYRFRGLTLNSFTTIFTLGFNKNYYCMGSTAADNDNIGPPIVFMASSVFQVAHSIFPILGSVGIDYRLGGPDGNEVQVMSHGANYLGLNMSITVFSNID
jgi:hypothetical protein